MLTVEKFFVVSVCLAFVLVGASFVPVDKHLIENQNGKHVVSTSELYKMLANGEQLFDRSYLHKQHKAKSAAQPTIPSSCTHQKEVDALANLLSVDFLNDELTTLTSFLNRFYTSRTGVSSAQWIHSEYEKTIAQYAPDGIIRSVAFFNHTWPQPSVIATIQGVGANANEKVIIGAHLDSVNWVADNQDLSRAPGACDDGSGTVTVMELFRVLSEAGLKLNRTVEFHHYAAEEVGLLGSQDIANSYAENDALVAGYLNFDMDAYPGNPGTFNIIADYTDSDLNSFLMQLIDTYSTIGYQVSNCGYACSDHASWFDVGYRSSFAIENGPYPYGHSANDKIQYLFLPYVVQYAKVGLGFLVEIGAIGA